MPSFLRTLIVSVSLALLLANCAKWKVNPYDLVPQVVQTLDVTSTGTTSIQISCRVTNVSSAPIKEYGIAYSASNKEPTTQDTKVRAATTDGSATTITLGNLQPKTTYYCRAYAISAADVPVYGETKTVTTGEPAPVVETLDVVGTPGSTSAQVQCRVTNASLIALKEFGIAYSSKNALPTVPALPDDGVVKATGPGSLTAVTLAGLLPNTTYNYRAYVINGAGTVAYGDPSKSFKTAAEAATINAVMLVSDKPSQLGNVSATVSFKVDKPAAVTEYGFVITADPNQVNQLMNGTAAPIRKSVTGAFPANGTIDFEIKDLNENSVYYAVAYAKDAAGKTTFSKEFAGFQTKYGQRGNWRQLANLPTERAYTYNPLFTINGKVYVGSQGRGISSDYYYLKQLYEYDPQTNLWTQKKDFPGTGRREPTVAVLNNKAYIMFGTTTNTGSPKTYTPDAWEYDPAGDSWRKMTDPPVTAPGGTGAYNQQAGGIPFVYNNRVHSLFGRGSSTSGSFTNLYNSQYALDPTGSGAWEMSFPLVGKTLSIAETYSIMRSGTFSFQYGDWVYYGGGVAVSEYTALGVNVNYGKDFDSRQIWGYNPKTKEIKKIARLLDTFNDCSDPVATGGRMANFAFVVGSKAYITDCSSQMWVMDLTSGNFTPQLSTALRNPAPTTGIGVGVGNKAYFGLRNGDWWEFTP